MSLNEWLIIIACFIGIVHWMGIWARSIDANQEFEDTDYPNEEDE